MLTETSFVVEGQSFTGAMCDATTDRARVAVTRDHNSDDGRISLAIAVMRHKTVAKLTPKHVRLIVGELPYSAARPLRVSQKATVLAALRFYQTHGGALDPDIQQFIASQDAQPLTADGVDELAELINKGDEMLVMAYGDLV